MARFSISPVKVGNLSFLILDCPSDKTLPAYIPVFEQHNVTDLVRICEGSPYDPAPLTAVGIHVHDDMKFEDGTAPGKDVVARWLALNDEVFFNSPTPDRCIAVHCVSGIGRAPVLVAISLVESGMDPLDAIAHIRKVRRGALNRVQIAFLDGYKKRKKGFGSSKKSTTPITAISTAAPTNGHSSGSSSANGHLATNGSSSLSSSSSSPAEPPPITKDKKSGFMSKLFGKK
ncbi:Protein tyrosine phosphatase type IVA 1 [Actinomortierella ambigua]|nr:Protein tyrosine phosphatase type IVA 1 [Actinomortierella ambigua]